MVLIKYVGKKEVQKDILYNSFITWHGKGDIQPVADDLSTNLLRHPDCYEVATQDEYEALNSASTTPAASGMADVSADDPVTTDAPAEASERVAAIVEAITGLDENDPSLWGKNNGKPNVKAIESALGYDITAAERDIACDAIDAEDNLKQ